MNFVYKEDDNNPPHNIFIVNLNKPTITTDQEDIRTTIIINDCFHRTSGIVTRKWVKRKIKTVKKRSTQNFDTKVHVGGFPKNTEEPLN